MSQKNYLRSWKPLQSKCVHSWSGFAEGIFIYGFQFEVISEKAL